MPSLFAKKSRHEVTLRFQSEESRLTVNSAVLSLISPVLDVISSQYSMDSGELVLQHGTATVMSKLILLSSGLSIPVYSLNELLELAATANDLQMPTVLSVLEDTIANKIELDDYATVIIVSHNRGLARTSAHALQLAAQNFHQFIARDDYLQIPERAITSLLADDNLVAMHEGAVCDGLMRWLNASGCISSLSALDQIRFPLIGPEYVAKRRPHWMELVSGHCNATSLTGKLKDLLLDASVSAALWGPAPPARNRARQPVQLWHMLLVAAPLCAYGLYGLQRLRWRQGKVRSVCVKRWRSRPASARAFRTWKAATYAGFAGDSDICLLQAGPAYLSLSSGPAHVSLAAGVGVCVCATLSDRRLTLTLCTVGQLKETQVLYKQYLHHLSAGPGSARARADARWLAAAVVPAAAAVAVVEMVAVAARLLLWRPVTATGVLAELAAAEAVAVSLSLAAAAAAAARVPRRAAGDAEAPAAGPGPA
jgi:hypothetical protein